MLAVNDGIGGDQLQRIDLVLAARQEDAIRGADALAICTEWKQFRIVDFNLLKSELSRPVIVDGRNLYDPAEVSSHGLLYYGIGRGDSHSLYADAGESHLQDVG